MDITSLFKACVKTVRTKNKAFGIAIDKSRILPRHSEKSDFTIKVKELMEQITRLRLFLLKHRKAYLNFTSHLCDSPRMTDEERDEIEVGAERIIGNSSYLITKLKREWKNNVGPSQLMEHHRIALDLVETYLKAVCEIYSEQKLMRVRRTVEHKKLSKLEPERVFTSPITSASYSLVRTQLSDDTESAQARDLAAPIESINEESFENYNADLSVEELQIFQRENLQLYNELNTLADEIRQIQSRVVRIAELQDVFTEKVLQQEEEIERISTTVIGSTENVKEGNEQLHQLMQKSAGLRAWALFFFIVMSFSLLFLHWYHD
ncbi:syntaxin-18 [Schistocerca piceifrons]|uniref:syntaxin-18 n=1 Tax=Schistocerca piceifrons TaxID=274613 RepID=UPI001F5FC2A7|nr:syntaxin-18 [Schistocerca piceifrons]